MSYVLTVIHPPANGATYGKAETFDPVPTKSDAAFAAGKYIVDKHGQLIWAGENLRHTMQQRVPGSEWFHVRTGLIFRIDPANNAPHPCPCGEGEPDACGRLVLPTAHAYAGHEDALCPGCFTWNRGDVQCLPANTAHPADKEG